MRDRSLDRATLESIIEQVGDTLLSQTQDLRTLLYQDMLLNTWKCKRDELDILDLKVISQALAEFRHAARVFKPYRHIRKVSVFGSARTPVDDRYYRLAVRFGQAMASTGFMIITGAAEGIMRAGIEGAGLDKSFGVNILLPFESGPTKAFQGDPKLMTFKYFFTRKVFFVMEADAFAFFPGGFGTHDEAFEVLTLLQTGKNPPMPVVLCELPGSHYWESWETFIREELLERGYISSEDVSLFRTVHSAEEGAAWIQSYYETYHSLRQVKDVLVLRLEKILADDQLAELTAEFSDLITAGVVTRTPALPQEQDEPELLAKPRIAFQYNRKSAGRLNQMILAINRMGRSIQATRTAA